MIKAYPTIRKSRKFNLTTKDWLLIIMMASVLFAGMGFLSGLVIGVEKGINIGIQTVDKD